MDKPFPLLTTKDIREMDEVPRRHQFNENVVRQTRSPGNHLGLTAAGVVNTARKPT